MELIIDGVGTNVKLMRSGVLLNWWIHDLVDRIGMSLVQEPTQLSCP